MLLLTSFRREDALRSNRSLLQRDIFKSQRLSELQVEAASANIRAKNAEIDSETVWTELICSWLCLELIKLFVLQSGKQESPAQRGGIGTGAAKCSNTGISDQVGTLIGHFHTRLCLPLLA